jgi:hypothetical protein
VKNTIGAITIGLALAALLAGCGEPKYSRVWVVNSAVSGKSMGVDERGMSREACELSVLNAGRTSAFAGMLTTGSVCVTDARALEMEQEEKTKKRATAEIASEASTPKAQPKEEVPDADAAQKRTEDLLKRTEALVVKPVSSPRPRGIVFGANYTDDMAIVDEKKVFAPGDKFAFVATFGRAVERLDLSIETARGQAMAQWSNQPDKGHVGPYASRLKAMTLPVGDYRLVVRNGGEILVSGEFSVQAR